MEILHGMNAPGLDEMLDVIRYTEEIAGFDEPELNVLFHLEFHMTASGNQIAQQIAKVQ